jgi:NADH-quinone oxidoreductase subunit G/NADP-reducing hydrogenase subunit HndD
MDALSDPKKHVVVQHAPAVSVSLGELMGIEPGVDIDGKMVAALREVGFDRVFDTSFTADLTIMEEGSELVQRVKSGGVLPMMTSCSPGWIKFVEQYYPEFIPNLSTCKSPQQMLGAIAKSYYAQQQGIDPKDIFSVSIMPCTAKKFEAARPEMGREGYQDVDAVLTTREVADLLNNFGINLNNLESQEPDTPFGTRSTAGKLFGVTGGVMEAAVRSAHLLITGQEAPRLDFEEVRGLEGVKMATLPIGSLNVKVAVASGLKNARKLMNQVRSGEIEVHFIEVMTCEGGCINGGGQPYETTEESLKARMKALYRLDGEAKLRRSHENPDVQRLYKEFLGAPLGHKSHELLHTHYHKRPVVK